MLIKKPADIRYSEITPKHIYMNRRNFLAGVPAAFLGRANCCRPRRARWRAPNCPTCRRASTRWTRSMNSYQDVSTYNNYYEFGTDKERAGAVRQELQDRRRGRSAWKATCAKPRKFTMEEILALAPLEERIYRHRCVEAWSIVVPWVGYSLSALLKQGGADVEGQVRRVRNLLRPASRCRTRPGCSSPTWKGCAWTKPCTRWRCCASGMYGETLPPQDGAPVRMVVPWKYGFKSIKSIVKIRLVGGMPPTTWNMANPPRVRLLLQRESEGGPSALEPGERAPAGRIPQAAHADVQRLRRPGGQPVHRDGSARKTTEAC